MDFSIWEAMMICAFLGAISNVSERTSFWCIFPQTVADAVAVPDQKDDFGDKIIYNGVYLRGRKYSVAFVLSVFRIVLFRFVPS